MIIKFNPRFKEEVTTEWVVGLDVNPEDLHYTLDEVKRFADYDYSDRYGKKIYRDRAKALVDAEDLKGALARKLNFAYEHRDEAVENDWLPDIFRYGMYGRSVDSVNTRVFPTAANETAEEIWDNYIHDLRVLQDAAVLVELKRKIVEEIPTKI